MRGNTGYGGAERRWPAMVLALALVLLPRGCCSQAEPQVGEGNTSNSPSDGIVLEEECIPEDKDALLHFKASVQYYPGTFLGSWTNETSCCSWVGVSCAMARVGSVTLPRSALLGPLPSFWSVLNGLQSLALNDNEGLTGPIPDEWSTLSRLYFLDLSSTGIHGTLPRTWSTLTGLHTVRLASSNHRGPLPVEWSALSNLEVLYITHSLLTGTLPTAYSALTALSRLELRTNQFSGTLPQAWSTLSSLTVLTLQAEKIGTGRLRGTLPEAWSTMLPLYYLNIENHQISGTLPASFLHLRNISNLSLGGNQLTGTLPLECTAWIYLSRLALNDNRLKGILPPAWSSLGGPGGDNQLELRLSRNQLEGSLPEEWSNLAGAMAGPQEGHQMGGGSKVLSEFHLASNRLTGSLPITWSTLTGIRQLDLSDNSLTSSLPPEMASWTALASLNLSGQPGIAGSIPPEFSEMTSIHSVSLDGTSVSCSSLLHFLPLNGAWPPIPSIPFVVALAGTEWYNRCLAELQRHRSLTEDILNAAIVAVGSALVALLALVAVVVPLHRATCKRQDCPHRHPGWWHSGVAHFGIERTSTSCPICSWSDKPDMTVDYEREVSHLIREERYIGGGSFGWVYRARLRGKEVAIKVMHSMKDERAYACFLQELEAGKQFVHCEHVARLLGACLVRPNVCIISEYLPGGTLNTRIHAPSQEAMVVREVLQMARDIASALSVLHPSYVHRDLKPENILLDAEGRPKLIDFGLGRSQGDDPFATAASTAVQGTPGYMAPEMFEGKVTPKVDIYALGVIMSECLSREKPFSNLLYPAQVFHAISVQGKRPPIATNCPPRLRHLITQCWHANPLMRPDAFDVLRKLDFLLSRDDEGSPSEFDFGIPVSDSATAVSDSQGDDVIRHQRTARQSPSLTAVL